LPGFEVGDGVDSGLVEPAKGMKLTVVAPAAMNGATNSATCAGFVRDVALEFVERDAVQTFYRRALPADLGSAAESLRRGRAGGAGRAGRLGG